MSRFRSIFRWSLPLAALACLQGFAGPASAHIHLLQPLPRYPDAVAGENKNCPCGVGTAGRTCSNPAERSDPNRSSDRATPLLGGSMLTVQLSEYVGHSGRFRVAFDPDGADVADFNQHILADIADPEGKQGNTGNGTLWEISARLPNIDCENCTLQVVQVMNGNTQDPVADTVGQSTYYQCADLQLTRDPSQPDGYAPPFIGPPLEEEETPVEAPVSAPTPSGTNTPASATMTLGTMPPANNGSSALPPAMTTSESGSDGGCSLAARSSAPAAPLHVSAAFAATALLVAARRRQRRD